MIEHAPPLPQSLCEIDWLLRLPVPETKPLDNYVTVELMRRVCRIRSFAMGGFPYFESTHRMDAPSTRAMVLDIVSGKLVPQVLELFDGIPLSGTSSVPCLVTDRRQAVSIKFSVTLTEKQSSDSIFNVVWARSASQEALNDLEAIDESAPSLL
jgi:hypothetical protein